MKFFSAVVLSVTIFVAAVAASPASEIFPCKPLLQSCEFNVECCGDLCLLGLCA
ncbi:hypothetical protein BDQ12DRAFT_692510 [Crucibulum laeve]|uniref:Uncharacterized protein n=1 Tax=Crucibulum laeve TaxID=68775 RepID=A0A5C3LID2_9AGAR|nr:hypothetical protein BDQ12DRAFT_692510 [Crucibulum laeve]